MIITTPPDLRGYVKERFRLQYADMLRTMTPEFGGTFGEFVYYRTYSRTMFNGQQEQWADTVIRVVNGVMSIRKQHYYNNNIPWDEEFWQTLAAEMALSLFKMQWLPPGRGLWAMGTDYVYRRGGMSLYNCAFTNLTIDELDDDIEWLMDALMNGVGVGFAPLRDLEGIAPSNYFEEPEGDSVTVQIGDDREGWVQSVKMLIQSYMTKHYGRWGGDIIFDYSKIRPEGVPINGFGGTASGPGPLRELHRRIRLLMKRAANDEIDIVQLKTDLANAAGCCVVAGNIRRSAEIGVAPINDPVFKNLKSYVEYPDRADIAHMSNNSVILESQEDFEQISQIADRLKRGEDLGFVNRVNTKRGRLGHDPEIERDIATGINPCGEIPLEHREVCNVAETLPTRCATIDEWLLACTYATFYCSTVSLLPTHRRTTNAMILKNRRIGVGIIDVSGWKHEIGVTKVTRALRSGYELVCRTNHRYNSEAGVPDSIRHTTIKPGGTTPKVAGKTSGIGHPTFKYTLMNVRVAKRWPGVKLMMAAGIPYEDELVDPENTYVFSIPVEQGPAKPATEVSLWEQAMNLILVQREWADNAVSNTLYYRPKWRFYAGHTIRAGQREVREWAVIYGMTRHMDQLLNHYETCLEDEISLVAHGEERQFRFKFDDNNECVILEVWEYDPRHEEDDLEAVLGHIAPLTKSVALLPHTSKGAFAQMPQQGITEEEYKERCAAIKSIDWSQLEGSDGVDERFCTKESCSLEKHG